MTNTNAQRRSRNGAFAANDREHRTAEQAKAFRAAEADLMARNAATPICFDVHCQPPSLAELSAVEGTKAIVMIHKGNAYAARIFATEAARLARLEIAR